MDAPTNQLSTQCCHSFFFGGGSERWRAAGPERSAEVRSAGEPRERGLIRVHPPKFGAIGVQGYTPGFF